MTWIIDAALKPLNRGTNSVGKFSLPLALHIREYSPISLPRRRALRGYWLPKGGKGRQLDIFMRSNESQSAFTITIRAGVKSCIHELKQFTLFLFKACFSEFHNEFDAVV